ncbi:hypothetical protein J6590_011935 [Homalodisca vitripennis]|nr:hypothetical protein J6590_011935 [Homalodisca vitripennis]
MIAEIVRARALMRFAAESQGTGQTRQARFNERTPRQGGRGAAAHAPTFTVSQLITILFSTADFDTCFVRLAPLVLLCSRSRYLSETGRLTDTLSYITHPPCTDSVGSSLQLCVRVYVYVCVCVFECECECVCVCVRACVRATDNPYEYGFLSWNDLKVSILTNEIHIQTNLFTVP